MVKKWIINTIIKNDMPDEDTVILEYGLSKMFMAFEDIIFTLFLGYLLGIFIESIIFQVLFMLLRMCAGGYHSESERKCKVYSVLVTVASLIFIKFLEVDAWISFFSVLAVSIVITILAPVEAIRKPLSDAERKINHRRTVCVVVVANLVLIADFMFGNFIFYKPIMVVMYGVCIFMVIGKVNNKRIYKREIEKKRIT